MNRRFWIVGLVIASTLTAAELKQETLNAWDRYVQSANAAMRDRLKPGHPFLWIDEQSDRRKQVRSGEILVNSVGDQNPKKVPSGLIHHWIGDVFLPNARLDEVLSVVRNYARYKDYYAPNVIDAHTIKQTENGDRFSMLLMNRAFFSKVALAGDYESSYATAGSHQCYSIATTVNVQEVDDYGEADEHKLPSDEGSGYVWRMHSIVRYEEADGGVYVELEAIALSRDIPLAARWVVDPIVRRVSKSAMVTSLRQTLSAVSSSGEMARSPATTAGLALGLRQRGSQR